MSRRRANSAESSNGEQDLVDAKTQRAQKIAGYLRSENHEEASEILLAHPEDNIKFSDKRLHISPYEAFLGLRYAIHQNNTDLVRLYLEAGAGQGNWSLYVTRDRDRPGKIAVSKQNTDICKLLFEYSIFWYPYSNSSGFGENSLCFFDALTFLGEQGEWACIAKVLTKQYLKKSFYLPNLESLLRQACEARESTVVNVMFEQFGYFNIQPLLPIALEQSDADLCKVLGYQAGVPSRQHAVFPFKKVIDIVLMSTDIDDDFLSCLVTFCVQTPEGREFLEDYEHPDIKAWKVEHWGEIIDAVLFDDTDHTPNPVLRAYAIEALCEGRKEPYSSSWVAKAAEWLDGEVGQDFAREIVSGAFEHQSDIDLLTKVIHAQRQEGHVSFYQDAGIWPDTFAHVLSAHSDDSESDRELDFTKLLAALILLGKATPDLKTKEGLPFLTAILLTDACFDFCLGLSYSAYVDQEALVLACAHGSWKNAIAFLYKMPEVSAHQTAIREYAVSAAHDGRWEDVLRFVEAIDQLSCQVTSTMFYNALKALLPIAIQAEDAEEVLCAILRIRGDRDWLWKDAVSVCGTDVDRLVRVLSQAIKIGNVQGIEIIARAGKIFTSQNRQALIACAVDGNNPDICTLVADRFFQEATQADFTALFTAVDRFRAARVADDDDDIVIEPDAPEGAEAFLQACYQNGSFLAVLNTFFPQASASSPASDDGEAVVLVDDAVLPFMQRANAIVPIDRSVLMHCLLEIINQPIFIPLFDTFQHALGSSAYYLVNEAIKQNADGALNHMAGKLPLDEKTIRALCANGFEVIDSVQQFKLSAALFIRHWCELRNGETENDHCDRLTGALILAYQEGNELMIDMLKAQGASAPEHLAFKDYVAIAGTAFAQRGQQRVEDNFLLVAQACQRLYVLYQYFQVNDDQLPQRNNFCRLLAALNGELDFVVACCVADGFSKETPEYYALFCALQESFFDGAVALEAVGLFKAFLTQQAESAELVSIGLLAGIEAGRDSLFATKNLEQAARSAGDAWGKTGHKLAHRLEWLRRTPGQGERKLIRFIQDNDAGGYNKNGFKHYLICVLFDVTGAVAQTILARIQRLTISDEIELTEPAFPEDRDNAPWELLSGDGASSFSGTSTLFSTSVASSVMRTASFYDALASMNFGRFDVVCENAASRWKPSSSFSLRRFSKANDVNTLKAALDEEDYPNSQLALLALLTDEDQSTRPNGVKCLVLKNLCPKNIRDKKHGERYVLDAVRFLCERLDLEFDGDFGEPSSDYRAEKMYQFVLALEDFPDARKPALCAAIFKAYRYEPSQQWFEEKDLPGEKTAIEKDVLKIAVLTKMQKQLVFRDAEASTSTAVGMAAFDGGS